MNRAIPLILGLLLAPAAPLRAQTATPPPRVEIGGRLATLSAPDFDRAVVLGEPQVSVRLTDNVAAEFGTDLRPETYPNGYSLYGIAATSFHST